MKIKTATVTTTIISFLGIMMFGWILWSGNEGGPEGQGALLFSVPMLPILFFTSVLFPSIAVLTKRKFTKTKWVGFNLLAVPVVALPLAIVLSSFAGSDLIFTLIFISVLMTGYLFLPSFIWIRMATSKNIDKAELGNGEVREKTGGKI